MANATYDDALNSLQACGENCRCTEIEGLLTKLGFRVRKAGNAGHRVYSHPSLKAFAGGDYNCGHGSNGKVKSVYVKKIIRTIGAIRDDVVAVLGGEDEERDDKNG